MMASRVQVPLTSILSQKLIITAGLKQLSKNIVILFALLLRFSFFSVSNPHIKLSHVFEGAINNFRLFSHPYITKRLVFQAENVCPYNPTTYANMFFQAQLQRQ